MDEEPVRRTWFGMNQPRPRLPYYLRLEYRRLRSLDEFEEPAWKGRTRWAEDDGKVTAKGIARDTLRWLLLFAIVVIITGSVSSWAGWDGCAGVVGGFRIGWC